MDINNIKSIVKTIIGTGIIFAQYWQEHVPEDGGTPFNILQYIIGVIIFFILVNFLRNIFGD